MNLLPGMLVIALPTDTPRNERTSHSCVSLNFMETQPSSVQTPVPENTIYPDSWPTLSLRIKRTWTSIGANTSQATETLQQAWHLTAGGIEWRNVPIVEEE